MSTTEIDRRLNSDTNGRRAIAVLGAGRMASAIAGRLAERGHELFLWSRIRHRALALGIGTVADTPAAAVSEADVVISTLTGPEAIRSSYTGPDAAIAAGFGGLFIEMSTAGPELMTSLAADLSAADGRLVDAQIVGAPPAVDAGQAVILIGGDDPDVALADPVLSALGTIRHVGPLGSGALLKLVANSMLADIVVAATELQAAGEQAGLQPDHVFWVLERMAPMLAARRGGIVENRHEPTLFAMRDLRDLRKDLDLALELFEPPEIQTPLTLQARQLVAAASGHGDLDIRAIKLRWRPAKRSVDPDARTSAPLAETLAP